MAITAALSPRPTARTKIRAQTISGIERSTIKIQRTAPRSPAIINPRSALDCFNLRFNDRLNRRRSSSAVAQITGQQNTACDKNIQPPIHCAVAEEIILQQRILIDHAGRCPDVRFVKAEELFA